MLLLQKIKGLSHSFRHLYLRESGNTRLAQMMPGDDALWFLFRFALHLRSADKSFKVTEEISLRLQKSTTEVSFFLR